jgi:nicotinamide-nucleotide adenylyltransferase
MPEKTKRGVFIGRFQPFHNGHASVLKAMDSAQDIEEILVGIGSYQYDFQHKKPEQWIDENPFTGPERDYMLSLALSKISKRSAVIPIPDIHDFPRWVSYVEELTPKFEVVYSGNTIVRELFEKKGYEVRLINSNSVSATTIRGMMARGESSWKKLVPKNIADYISSISGDERVRNLYEKRKVMRNPIPVVDAIIDYSDAFSKKGIILVNRKNPPLGWALPGGYIEYGESAEEACIREVYEETGLEIKIDTLWKILSDPKRDPRQHNISICYLATAHKNSYNLPRAGDDAKGIRVVELYNELPKFLKNNNIAFDHAKILNEYREKCLLNFNPYR